MNIANIHQAISNDHVRVTNHAEDEMVSDDLALDDVIESVLNGEVIEDYPVDRPLPSCLIYGCTKEQQHIHTVWAYNERTGWAVLITVYRPDPNRWEHWRKRK